jgi:VIT1/CCC1 family predicted Fe2+/Mn2+ transporter
MAIGFIVLLMFVTLGLVALLELVSRRCKTSASTFVAYIVGVLFILLTCAIPTLPVGQKPWSFAVVLAVLLVVHTCWILLEGAGVLRTWRKQGQHR